MSSSQTSSSSSDNGASGQHVEQDELIAPMLDIGCAVDFVLGSGTLTLRDCLLLEPQTIVRLAQSAGSDMSVIVHGVPVAIGEVVIIDDKTALRVSRVVPPAGIEAA